MLIASGSYVARLKLSRSSECQSYPRILLFIHQNGVAEISHRHRAYAIEDVKFSRTMLDSIDKILSTIYPYRRSARLAIRDPKNLWVIAWRLAGEKSRREKPVCPQKCERVQIIPDSITVIMPVIYVLHTHARTHALPPLAPLNSPRGGTMNTLLSKHARRVAWRGVASLLDYLERSHVGSPGSWKRVERVERG